MRTLQVLRLHHLTSFFLLAATLLVSAIPAETRATEPTDMVIPVVGTIVASINEITCPIRSTVGCPGPIPKPCSIYPNLPTCKTLPDPCRTVDIPGVCHGVSVNPCDYYPAPGVCTPLPPTNPCYYAPGAPVVCSGQLPPTDPCYYRPDLPGVCTPLPPLNPCTYKPNLPGVCAPLPQNSVELTSLQTAIAIGNFKPDVTVVPRDPGPVVNLLGFCQPYLNQFLTDTEYLGPLLDYGTCLNTNSLPAVMNSLPIVVNNVTFLAGVCNLMTSAFEDNNRTFVDFSGFVDCSAGSSSEYVFKPYINGSMVLQKFLRPDILPASCDSALHCRLGSSIQAADPESGTAKIKLVSSITPSEESVCAVGGVCGFKWIVAPNKNPDTGTSTSCATTGDVLNCTTGSIPLTDSTIAHRENNSCTGNC